MPKLFDMKASDLINLRRFYRRAPKQFKRAVLNMVNGFAFGTRKESISIIKKRLTVRNERFVSSRVRVKKAFGARPHSEVGSIKSPRFTGWAEQELGEKTKRTRVFSLMARKGNYKSQAMPSARLKPGANHINPEDYPGKTNRFRTMAMLSDIRRRRLRRPFVIKRHRKFKPGLYKMVGRKIEQLQQFKTRVQPKRVRWLSGGARAYFKTHNLREEWAKSIRHILKRK